MIEYLFTAILFVLLDSIYLNLIKNYFNKQIIDIQGSPIQINYTAAAITYIFLIYGLNTFIIQKNKSVSEAALLGFIIYGVYEFTNLSIIKNWRILTAIIDTTWGAVLFALTTAIIYKVRGIFYK
jgi:uncharacterized membrane protein